MLRRKKTTPAAEKEPVSSVSEGSEPATAVIDPAAEGTAAAAPSASESSQQKDRFRSWVSDSTRGYERLTDEQARQLVLKFSGKPEPEVLSKLKEGGFRFQPEYFGQKKVWTRRNDFEGRIKVEELESLVRGPVQEQEASR